jgi:hypothetical protein
MYQDDGARHSVFAWELSTDQQGCLVGSILQNTVITFDDGQPFLVCQEQRLANVQWTEKSKDRLGYAHTLVLLMGQFLGFDPESFRSNVDAEVIATMRVGDNVYGMLYSISVISGNLKRGRDVSTWVKFSDSNGTEWTILAPASRDFHPTNATYVDGLFVDYENSGASGTDDPGSMLQVLNGSRMYFGGAEPVIALNGEIPFCMKFDTSQLHLVDGRAGTPSHQLVVVRAKNTWLKNLEEGLPDGVALIGKETSRLSIAAYAVPFTQGATPLTEFSKMKQAQL